MGGVKDFVDSMLPIPDQSVASASTGTGEIPALLLPDMGQPPVNPALAISMLFPIVSTGVSKVVRFFINHGDSPESPTPPADPSAGEC